jgi:beta-lactamase class A
MRVFVVLSWLLALVAQPAWAYPQAAGFQTLEQQLGAMAASAPGEYGIAAVDLSTGSMVSFNGSTPFPMASTMKVAVAAAYLSQVDHGRRSLSDTIAGRTAAELIELMLTRSDNPATDILIENLGGPKAVDEWLLRDRRDLKDPRDSATPIAMVTLLSRIDRGDMLKPESRDYLLQTMGRCITGKNRIRGLLPPGTRVEHKTGTLAGLSGDVGIITLADGRRIAVAIFGRGGTNRAQTIAATARAIYDGFGAQTQPVLAAAPVEAAIGTPTLSAP